MVYNAEHEPNTTRGEKSCENQSDARLLDKILQNRVGNIRLDDPEKDQGLGKEHKARCDVSKKTLCFVHFFLSA